MSDPKTVTLTVEDYNTLKDLSNLTIKAANTPATRKKFAAIVKEVDPSRRFPDVEADDIRAEVKQEFEKRDLERVQRSTLSHLEQQKAAVAGRYDEKAMTEIEALMSRHSLSDYELAARIYAAETKPATPTPQPNDHRWTLPNIELKDFNNLQQIGRAKAYSVIDEITAARASTRH